MLYRATAAGSATSATTAVGGDPGAAATDIATKVGASSAGYMSIPSETGTTGDGDGDGGNGDGDDGGDGSDGQGDGEDGSN